jgi:hypothetical protein
MRVHWWIPTAPSSVSVLPSPRHKAQRVAGNTDSRDAPRPFGDGITVGARAAVDTHLNGFSSKVREQDVRGCLRPDCCLARVLVRGSGESTARESQAKRLSKATDKAYFVRRLRARAGTVVAPGPHFFLRGGRCSSLPPETLESPGRGCGLYTQATSRPARWLPCMDCGFLAADVQVRACPARLCDRALRELALRVDPGTPSASPPLPTLHRRRSPDHSGSGSRHLP